MVKKVVIAVILSLAITMIGGYIALAGSTFGGILAMGTPFVATIYLVQTYNISKGTKKHGDKKARIVTCIGIVVVLGALPAVLVGEVLSEKIASWRSEVHRKQLVQQAEVKTFMLSDPRGVAL